MLRRQLLAALPTVAALAAPALARSKRQGDGITHAGRQRVHTMTTYSSKSSVKPRLHQTVGSHGSHILSLTSRSTTTLAATATLGLSFDALPGFRRGVAFWRYAPWKSWTKPMAMTHAGDLQTDDVQCGYWQYDDGTYGVALPLGGGGFRTTLGAVDGHMATVCRALGPARPTRPMPQLAIGFGQDLYATMTSVFADAMAALGTPENLRAHKVLPEALTYLGWNTWNASNLGHDLAADWVLAQVDTIKAAGAPVRTVVLDDGYFQQRDSRLQSQAPNVVKFPNGFKPVVDALTTTHGMKHVGVWHAFDAYWNGIDPQSDLGRAHAADLFTWTQSPSPTDVSGTLVTYSFLKPDPAILDPYFDAYYAGLKAAGLSLVKVDNQLVAERMARDNYPIWDLAKNLHGAINKAAGKYFDNALINCMDMTNDAFLNFGMTAVARSVEDYFPYKATEGYDLQEGNAAAHVTQAMYNALYFGEMVFPDFDMFESTNPNAALHAAVRAANCAPIYITDKAGQHDIALLKSLVDADGLTLRADTPLRPTKDCLFQIQAPVLFKASSRVGDGTLLLLANLADADEVKGDYALDDVTGLAASDYVVYSPRLGTAERRDRHTRTPYAATGRFGHELLQIASVHSGMAVIGVAEKLNSLASVSDVQYGADGVNLTARDQGTLLVWCDKAPGAITVDGVDVTVLLDRNLLRIPLNQGARTCRVTLKR